MFGAVFNVQGSYHPTEVIVREADKYNDLCRSALRELEAFRKKYLVLSDYKLLEGVFSAIDAATDKKKAPPAGKRARQTA